MRTRRGARGQWPIYSRGHMTLPPPYHNSRFYSISLFGAISGSLARCHFHYVINPCVWDEFMERLGHGALWAAFLYGSIDEKKGIATKSASEWKESYRHRFSLCPSISRSPVSVIQVALFGQAMSQYHRCYPPPGNSLYRLDPTLCIVSSQKMS